MIKYLQIDYMGKRKLWRAEGEQRSRDQASGKSGSSTHQATV